MVGHYNRGRHREALRQFDFVGRSSKLGTTEFLHETPGRVGGDDDGWRRARDLSLSETRWTRSPTRSEGDFGTRPQGVLELLAEGMVRGMQVMLGEYKLRIGEWQLFVGELVLLSPQFARR